MYKAVDIAVALLKAAHERGLQLTQMQLQKLVYVTHGLSLATRGLPMINENVNAWQYGPVIPEVYHRFKIYGNQNIDFYSLPEAKFPQMIDAESMNLISITLDNFGSLNGGQLSEMAHRSGSPWHSVWFDGCGNEVRGAIISNDLIRQHYQQVVNSGVVQCL
ncbi:Panacea domain-containing protein [Shewanella decolorationis]|uniref:Panacea domain-containing protein n=1 Tax=Shewanella decolorationis TaxID=256839 RepID=UPI00105715D5|nr:type II toxin-antitoxin system antitoxin SocA domain-containing protein [Shewanella decolorationis]